MEVIFKISIEGITTSLRRKIRNFKPCVSVGFDRGKKSFNLVLDSLQSVFGVQKDVS